jgi:asparagine synthase (glutamine-hydrolysing)
MCGISGFIDFSKKSSEEVLQAMTDTLYHRGPDASGNYFHEDKVAQIGLGHRRLSIIDLSETGKQPMHYKHLCITYNGEVYNFNEIKNELVLLGHQFIGHSDTEVILHAFEQWGIKCVGKFIGMFALVIFDDLSKKIFCLRDRAGVKPFYYYWHENLFLFASELKAFHKHPLFNKEIDLNAIAAYMQYGNVPEPYCIFKNCYKLKPAHYLIFDLEQRTFEIAKYWNVYDFYNKQKLDISFSEAKSETEKILSSAFNYRMVADVPIGVFLSGGYDSACLTAILQKNRTEKLKTFTIAVPDIGLNEAPYAKEIAKHIGSDHSQYDCTQKEAVELINELPYYYDEPFGDSSAIPTTLVCKIARQQVTVALSADGGDEVFAGYNRYDYMVKYGKLLNQTPSFMRKSAAELMQRIPAEKLPYFKSKYNFANRYEKLKLLLKDPSPQNLMDNLNKQFTKEDLSNLFINEISHLNTSHLSEELKPESFSALSYMMAIDYQTYLPDDILQKVDRASMTSSLEAREPFLDHRIIEFAAQLPDNYKYNQGIKKHILREITHHYIPKQLLDRPKMGFAIPIENWLMNDLKHQVNYYLDTDKIKKQGIFNLTYIEKLRSEFLNGKKELGVKLWYLLMFQMWHEKWMR